MKPTHSHGLEVGDTLKPEIECCCEWVYVEFYPPVFELVKKCDSCEHADKVMEQVRRLRESTVSGQ